MGTVQIIDYGMGNLDSCYRALIEAGGTPVIVNSAADYRPSEPTILPGVGAFGDAMTRLHAGDWVGVLGEAVKTCQTPFLGVCLGMQLFATRGEEGGGADGLGWIDGTVRRLEPGVAGERIPHVGWNEVELVETTTPLFQGISTGTDFYFTHSYHFACATDESLLGTTPYCSGIASVIGRDNLLGMQFHPEKSQRPGLLMYKIFLAV